MLIGPTSDDEDSGDEKVDEDDTEEARELESFRDFLKQQKVKQFDKQPKA